MYPTRGPLSGYGQSSGCFVFSLHSERLLASLASPNFNNALCIPRVPLAAPNAAKFERTLLLPSRFFDARSHRIDLFFWTLCPTSPAKSMHFDCPIPTDAHNSHYSVQTFRFQYLLFNLTRKQYFVAFKLFFFFYYFFKSKFFIFWIYRWNMK